jgi:hypothetical protein
LLGGPALARFSTLEATAASPTGQKNKKNLAGSLPNGYIQANGAMMRRMSQT